MYCIVASFSLSYYENKANLRSFEICNVSQMKHLRPMRKSRSGSNHKVKNVAVKLTNSLPFPIQKTLFKYLFLQRSRQRSRHHYKHGGLMYMIGSTGVTPRRYVFTVQYTLFKIFSNKIRESSSIDWNFPFNVEK